MAPIGGACVAKASTHHKRFFAKNTIPPAIPSPGDAKPPELIGIIAQQS
jgi:hypothetical protein